jgi:hypothetical protein
MNKQFFLNAKKLAISQKMHKSARACEHAFACELITDVQRQILVFLHIADISKIGQTSKYFQSISCHETLWKCLLKRDIKYHNVSVAYDICCIEKLNFRESYRNVSDDITVEELFKASNQLLDDITVEELFKASNQLFEIRPYTSATLTKVLSYDIASIMKGYINCLSRIIDCLYFINPKDLKIEQYLKLFKKYMSLNILGECNFWVIGFVFWNGFKNAKKAKKCWIRTISDKNKNAGQAFVDGLFSCNMDLQESVLWCSQVERYFPTRRYYFLFAIADRCKNYNKVLELSLECLCEYDTFMEKKPKDGFVVKSSDEIKRYHILKLIAVAYYHKKFYKESYEYWKQTLSEIKIIENTIIDEFTKNVYYDLINVAFHFVNKIEEAQMYILTLTTILTGTYQLDNIEAKKVANWQMKCMEKYLELNNWTKLKVHHSHFLYLADIALDGFTRSAYEFECIANFYQGHYILGIEADLKACHVENKRATRYLGKCYVKIKEYEKAHLYFTLYVKQYRNCIILLEFALLRLETDSSYYDIVIANQLLQEALTKPEIESFDQIETMELVRSKLKCNKRNRE